MAMNLLSIAQEFCHRTTLIVPNFIASNNDPQIAQILGLLNEFCDDLTIRKAWQTTILETTFTSIASEDQGNINTLCPYGFEGIVQDSIYDRTQRLPLIGGISPQYWQSLKALSNTGSFYQFRIRGDHLLFTPALVAGHTIAFEYESSFYVKNNNITVSDPALFRQYWMQDSDTCLLGDRLPLAFLRWAWKKEKGLDYAEDFVKYERLMNVRSAKDARPQNAYLDAVQEDYWPMY